MSEGRSKALLALSWLWIATVAGYMVWGASMKRACSAGCRYGSSINGASFIRSRRRSWPASCSAAPAFWYIRRRATMRAGARSDRGRPPKRGAWPAARATRRSPACSPFWSAAAPICSRRRLPDGSEKAALYDGARLGREPAPDGKVRIAGQLEPEARTDYTETGGIRPRVTHYVGFRPDDTPADAPLQPVRRAQCRGREQLRTVQAFLPEQTGYLIENGMPAARAARAAKRRACAWRARIICSGPAISPGASLIISPPRSRACLASACLAVAGIGGIQAGSRRRFAEALEAQRRAQGG